MLYTITFYNAGFTTEVLKVLKVLTEISAFKECSELPFVWVPKPYGFSVY